MNERTTHQVARATRAGIPRKNGGAGAADRLVVGGTVVAVRRAPRGGGDGLGSLPHRDAARPVLAARERTGDDPSPPRRLPAESLIAQAVVGTPGITLGQYGAIAVDLDRLDRRDRWSPTSRPSASVAFVRFSTMPRVRHRRLDRQVVVRGSGHAGGGVAAGRRAGGDRVERRRTIRTLARDGSREGDR